MISLFVAPPLPVAVPTPACPCSPAWAPRQRLRQADPEIIDKHSLGLEPAKLPATPADFSLASIIFLDDSMFRSLSGRDQRLLVTFFFWFYASVVLKDPRTNRAERLGSQRLQLSVTSSCPQLLPASPQRAVGWAGFSTELCPGLHRPHSAAPLGALQAQDFWIPTCWIPVPSAKPSAPTGSRPAACAWARTPGRGLSRERSQRGHGSRSRTSPFRARRVLVAEEPGCRLCWQFALPQRAKINSSTSHGQFPP